MVTYLGSPVQSCCGEGGTLQTNITGMCGECSQCLGRTGFAPAHGVCAFPVYTAQILGCSARELSEAGPGLHALPRSKPLRFRFSGTLQRHRLGLGLCFVPFPGPSSLGDQVLGEHGCCNLLPPLSLPLGFLGVQTAHLLRCAVCLFWGADLWLQPSRRMSTVQNPKKSWLATKPACSLVDDASLGP